MIQLGCHFSTSCVMDGTLYSSSSQWEKHPDDVSSRSVTEWFYRMRCLAYPISTLRWFRVRVWSHFKHFRISMPPKWMVIGYEMVWIGYPKTTNPFKLQEFLRRLRILSDDGVTFLSQTVTWSDFETPCCFSAASALETAKRENAFLDRSFRLMVMRYWYCGNTMSQTWWIYNQKVVFRRVRYWTRWIQSGTRDRSIMIGSSILVPTKIHVEKKPTTSVECTSGLWNLLLAKARILDFNCFVFFPFLLRFPVFFLLFFLLFFTVCGCFFFVLPFVFFWLPCLVWWCVATFLQPGFSILRLNMSAKHSCKNTEYETFDFGASDPNRTPTQKGKMNTKEIWRKQDSNAEGKTTTKKIRRNNTKNMRKKTGPPQTSLKKKQKIFGKSKKQKRLELFALFFAFFFVFFVSFFLVFFWCFFLRFFGVVFGVLFSSS